MNDPKCAVPDQLSLSPQLNPIAKARFSNDLLRAVADLVLSTTYDGVWLIDTEARTTFVNERTAQLLGYSVDEMLGVSLFEFMDADGRTIAERNLARRRDGVAEQHEFKCVRKDGSPIWLLVTANPVYDRAGGYAGSLALIADFSLMKAREDALLTERAELARQLQQFEQTRASLEAAAHHDGLTGLRSRFYVEQRLAEELARSRRHGRRLCLILFDVDHFKRVNHRWGRAAGDDLLRGIASTLRTTATADAPGLLRASDIAGRFDGDEFVVLAPETDLEGGYRLAERILEAMSHARVSIGAGEHVVPALSAGVAAFPFHASQANALVAAADCATYRAKLAGGGRACLAERPT